MIYPITKDEAKKHRYRVWSGNPNGDIYIGIRCAYSVADGGRSVLSHQCYKLNGHGPDDLYCKQHAKIVMSQLGISKEGE